MLSAISTAKFPNMPLRLPYFLYYSMCSFICMFCRSLFVLFLLAIVLSNYGFLLPLQYLQTLLILFLKMLFPLRSGKWQEYSFHERTSNLNIIFVYYVYCFDIVKHLKIILSQIENPYVIETLKCCTDYELLIKKDHFGTKTKGHYSYD